MLCHKKSTLKDVFPILDSLRHSCQKWDKLKRKALICILSYTGMREKNGFIINVVNFKIHEEIKR